MVTCACSVSVTGVSLTGSASSSPISVISMTDVDVCKVVFRVQIPVNVRSDKTEEIRGRSKSVMYVFFKYD